MHSVVVVSFETDWNCKEKVFCTGMVTAKKDSMIVCENIGRP